MVLGETEVVGEVSAKTWEKKRKGRRRRRNVDVLGRELRNLLAIGS